MTTDRALQRREEPGHGSHGRAPLAVPFHGGKGQPLVLLHGLETTAEQWRPVGVALAKRNEVAIVDLLGFGASRAPLTAAFTLEEHAAAVWATVDALFGERPVRLVGHGLGAAVAVACAAERPDAVTELVAFSPALAPPTGEDPQAAAALQAELERVRAEGERRVARTLAAEAVAERVVPRARSLAAALGADGEALLARVTAPVVVVAPDADALTPKQWLRRYASEHPDHVSVIAAEGGRLMPFENAVAAAKLIEPGSEEVLKAARREQPVEIRRVRTFDQLWVGETSLQFRRGALLVLGGVGLLLAGEVPGRSVLLGVAVGLLVEALMVVAGAFGLLRAGRRGVAWFLVGLVSFGFALYLTTAYALSTPVAALGFAAWLLARGASDLVVAWRAERARRSRWTLFAQGALGCLVGAAAVVAPAIAGSALHYTLGGYLGVAGVLTLGYAWAARREIVGYLADALRVA